MTRAETAALVRAVARANTAARALSGLEDEVWAASDGNPFVVVQTVRALQEGALLRGPTGLPLPERVRRVVSVRLDSLSERARQLLPRAAVIGRPFSFELLARAAALEEADAALGLEELVRRRVLTGVGELFDFVHHHVRQTVLDDLLAPRRRLCHAAVAAALETLRGIAPEPLDAALGDHYLAAESWERAAQHLRAAGHWAAARGVHREAVARFDQAMAALGRLERDPRREALALDLLFDLRHSLVPLGHNARVQECLESARAQAERLGDAARLARAEAGMALHLQVVGQPEQAMAAGERALALAEPLPDPSAAIIARQYLGQACHTVGDFRRAASLLGEVVTALDGRDGPSLGLPFLVPVFARTWAAMSLAELGEFSRALALGAEAERLALAADRSWERAVAGLAIGQTWLIRGELAEATTSLEGALATAQAAQVPGWEHIITLSLAYARALSGRLQEGRRSLESAADSPAGERSNYRPGLLSYLAEARLLDGDRAGAATAAASSRDLARARGMRAQEALASRAVAAVTAAGGDTDVAMREYAVAAELAEALGMRPLLARVRVERGLLLARARDPARSRQELVDAAEAFEALGMRAWLARAREARRAV
jgi:tetratricopeptide (TPR) repeat protein